MGDEFQSFACRHGSTVFDDQTGEHVCEGCGKVVDKSNNENSNGVGFSPLLGSRILEDEKDKLGINHRLTNQYPNEVAWYNQIENLSEKANMPEYVVNSIYQFYLRNRKEMRRMHKKEAITALMYAYGKARSTKTLAQLCEETTADNLLARRYLLYLGSSAELKIPYKPPEFYVGVYASKLNAPKDVAERATEIVRNYEHGSENPRSLAASSLYLAYRMNGEKRTQREIADYAGLAEYTVREVSARMRKALGGDYGR